MPPSWWDEESMLADLNAARSVTVPDAVLRDARAAFGRRQVGGRTATLAYDSVLDDQPEMRAVGAEDRRMLSFEADAVSVEVEVSAGRLTGQLVPPAVAEVELLGPDGELARTRTDEVGCFVLDRPPPGPVRFRLPGLDMVTEWVLL